MNKEQEAFEKDHGISSYIKWDIQTNRYILTDNAEMCHTHWVDVANKLLPVFAKGYKSGRASADAEIKELREGMFPEFDDEVKSILGRPNFACAQIARRL